MTAAACPMEALLSQPALRFAGERHDVADLVLVGMLTGRWQALVASVARGVDLEARQADAIGAEELDRAVVAFRYGRRLIAGAEMEAWLSARSLTLADLEGVLRRRWLLMRTEDRPTAPAPDHRAAQVIRAEAICSGMLADAAEQLKAWHAASAALAPLDAEAAGVDNRSGDDPSVDEVVSVALADTCAGLATLGPDELRRRTARLAVLRAGHERFRLEGVPAAAVEARLAERRVMWTAVVGRELSFDREGAGLETRLRVTHDGETLAAVAASLGLQPAPRRIQFGDAPAGLVPDLVAARVGDLVGPWREGDRWRVLEIDERAELEAGDGRIRARDELLAELVDRISASKAEVLAAL